MTGRIQCCVPYCRRTRENKWLFAEWICQEHWRGVRSRRRRLLSAVKRKAKRVGWTPALQAIEGRQWPLARAEAIERAAGIR